MSHAVFFVATARSATQWLAHTLECLYPAELRIAHEPIGYAYNPKRYLRAFDRMEELRRVPAVGRHLDGIHASLRHRSFVEVGFPVYAATPLLHAEFGDRLRIVHLTRHPVAVAASLVTHHWYHPDRDRDVNALVAPEPTDAGVVQKDYASRWRRMRPLEKGLFYWAEVHWWGREINRHFPSLPILRLRVEDLLRDPTEQHALCDFLEVPHRDWVPLTRTRVDRFSFQTTSPLHVDAAWSHPRIAALARDLGYDFSSIDPAAIRQRYQAVATGWRARLHGWRIALAESMAARRP